MKGAEKIEIDRRYCKGCMLCKYICPREVYEAGTERSDLDYLMPQVARIEKCIVCRQCEQHCPDMVITVTGKEKS
ncbi:MAG: 4Fe-4S dicluster domain-containing protein [Syntrophaceae bacterium]|nr:4Fe-4S dicluster domain-containing protein [Syntrophaceae bacterium]